MRALVVGNLGVRFLLEIVALAALVVWGVTSFDGVTGWLIGAGAAAAFAAAWGILVSPRARVRLGRSARLGVELALFGSAALALAGTGRATLAVVFAVVAVVSGAINHAAG